MADYVSNYSGAQIDEAVGRALPGGTLEALIADKVPKDAVLVADCAAIKENGWYITNSATLNLPNVGASNIIHAKALSDSLIVLEGYNFDYLTPIVAVITSAGIKPWEYPDPPMYLGEEYRTTERYLGKPVYKKIVSMTVPTAGATSMLNPHNIANIQHAIDAKVSFYNPGWSVNGSDGYVDTVDFATTSVSFKLSAGAGDMTVYIAYVTLSYTKTTD